MDHRHRNLWSGVRFSLLADHDPPRLLRPDQVGRSAAWHGRSRTDHGARPCGAAGLPRRFPATVRSEEHTSELQSLMRISYAVFCLKKKRSSDRLGPTLITNVQTTHI